MLRSAWHCLKVGLARAPWAVLQEREGNVGHCAGGASGVGFVFFF